MKLVAICTCLVFLTAVSLVWADDYAQWRGPNRDGVSKDVGLLRQWPAEGPRLVWKATGLGSGWSTPSVAKGSIYLVSSPDDKTEEVIAVSAADGKKIWSTNIGAVGPNTKAPYPGPRSTPTVDGYRLYAISSDGDLVCLDASKGKVAWKKSFRADFGGKPGYWAYAESPLVDGDVVVCCPGGKDAAMVALNKTDGKVVWQCAIEGELPGYASIVIGEVGGIRQYIQFLDKGVVGVEAKTGKFLWRYDKTSDSQGMNIPTPIFHDGYVMTSTLKIGPDLVKLTVDGAKITVSQVYASNKLQNHHGGMVRVGDHVYGTTGSSLVCVEYKSGKEMWKAASVGKGSLCYADGCLYVRGEKGGAMALVEATPIAYQEKGRFTPAGGSATNVWSHPVIANGCLYLLDQNSLFCYDVKAK